MMIQFYISLLFTLLINPFTLVDFSKETGRSGWMVVDDGVMGGLSAGRFRINDEGHAVFSGTVSLENNGGFSSVRCRMNTSVNGTSKFLLRIKGDGKNYQLRVKRDARTAYSYEAIFRTSGQWETIEIPYEQLIPSFRGRLLNRPSFAGEQVQELGFLIGNKKEEAFELLIDKIEVQ
jgi:hypothetical protein